MEDFEALSRSYMQNDSLVKSEFASFEENPFQMDLPDMWSSSSKDVVESLSLPKLAPPGTATFDSSYAPFDNSPREQFYFDNSPRGAYNNSGSGSTNKHFRHTSFGSSSMPNGAPPSTISTVMHSKIQHPDKEPMEVYTIVSSGLPTSNMNGSSYGKKSSQPQVTSAQHHQNSESAAQNTTAAVPYSNHSHKPSSSDEFDFDWKKAFDPTAHMNAIHQEISLQHQQCQQSQNNQHLQQNMNCEGHSEQHGSNNNSMHARVQHYSNPHMHNHPHGMVHNNSAHNMAALQYPGEVSSFQPSPPPTVATVSPTHSRANSFGSVQALAVDPSAMSGVNFKFPLSPATVLRLADGSQPTPVSSPQNARASPKGAVRVKIEPCVQMASPAPSPTSSSANSTTTSQRKGSSNDQFRCDKCNKVFTSRYSHRRHAKQHTGERPYVCPYDSCKSSFAERSTLTRHIRIHTGEKPYTCGFPGCNKAFADRTNVKRHQMTHTGKKPYRCPLTDCTKAYSRRCYLSRHICHSHGLSADEAQAKAKSVEVRMLGM